MCAEKRGRDRNDSCREHKTVPKRMRIQRAHATGLLAACPGINTGCRMGCGDGTRGGVRQGPHNSPLGSRNRCAQKGGQDQRHPCKEHETVPGLMRIQ